MPKEPKAELLRSQTHAGRTYQLYRLTNDSGASVCVCNWGLCVQSIRVPDRHGELGEVVIGYDELWRYRENPVGFGATIGRFANRIAGARFSLDGETYILPANNGPNNLHGGPRGLGQRPWNIGELGQDESMAYLSATFSSPDGFNGFPGNLVVGVSLLWTNQNQLILNFQAISDAPTVVNLTNHSYFNLAGGGTVLDHELRLAARQYTPTNEHQIPTGELKPVRGTPFDFTEAKPIGRDIEAAGGYDHNFVVEGYEKGKLRPVGTLRDPHSGRTLQCSGTQPGIQLFTANFGAGEFTERGDRPLPTHGGVCLETQHYPDSPNQSHFPTTTLRSGEKYLEKVVYAFGTDSESQNG